MEQGGAQIVAPLEDAIGTQGASVSLFCEVNDKTSQDIFIWRRQLLNRAVEIIFDSSDHDSIGNHCDKFCVTGNFNLEIRNLEFQDAGNYICELVGKNTRTAALTVVRKLNIMIYESCLY